MHTGPQPWIREVAAGDDVAAITSLIHAAYAAHARAGLRFWGAHQSAEDTAARLAQGTGLLLFAADRLAGTLTLRPPQPGSEVPLYREPGVYSISQFCVHPDFQGRGFGRRLHDEAVHRARAGGATRLALDTARPATGLVRLYAHWGYRVVGEHDWRPFTTYPSVVMCLDLA